MLTKDELLDIARNPLRAANVRKDAWERYQIMCWVEAVRDRGLTLSTFSDPTYRFKLSEAVKAAEITPRRSECYRS